MDMKTAVVELDRPLRFGDLKQIAAYEHVELVAEVAELLAYLLEGDESEAYDNALRDALSGCWDELATAKQGRPPRAKAWTPD